MEINHTKETQISDQPPISIEEYKRIHNTVYSVIGHGIKHGLIDKQPILGCSNMINIVGAFVASKCTEAKITCFPYVGLAMYYLNNKQLDAATTHNFVLTHAKRSDNLTAVSGTHTWIETNSGWVIDFTAPFFLEAMQSSPALMSSPELMKPFDCGRKVFIKKLTDSKKHWSEMSAPGDFYLAADSGRTSKTIATVTSALMKSLCLISAEWYCRGGDTMEVSTPENKKLIIPYQETEINGAW